MIFNQSLYAVIFFLLIGAYIVSLKKICTKWHQDIVLLLNKNGDRAQGYCSIKMEKNGNLELKTLVNRPRLQGLMRKTGVICCFLKILFSLIGI